MRRKGGGDGLEVQSIPLLLLRQLVENQGKWQFKRILDLGMMEKVTMVLEEAANPVPMAAVRPQALRDQF